MTDKRPDEFGGDAADDDTASMEILDPETLSASKVERGSTAQYEPDEAISRAATSETAAQAVSEPSPARAGGGLLPFVALIASLAAFACSGVLLWQYRQFYVSLADADAQAQAALERVRAAAQVSDGAIADLDTNVATQQRELLDFEARLESVPGQFADVQRRIDAIQGGSFDARNQWLEAEAQWYLSVANSELQLGGRFENALTALRLADDRLRETGDPGLAGVREQVAAEILALESVRLVDVEGLAHSLSRLAQRVADLPLRTGPVSAGGTEAPVDEQEPGLQRLWSSVKSAFSNIVTVERRDAPIVAALSAEEMRLIRRQLGVELQSARLALVGAEAEIFRASLQQAAVLLREDFDGSAAEVEGGLRLVESLLDLDIAPTPPDISRSLYALRARGAQ